MYWWVQMINQQGISYLSTNAKSCETGHVKVQNFGKKAVTGATYPELPELLKKVKRQKKVITLAIYTYCQ